MTLTANRSARFTGLARRGTSFNRSNFSVAFPLVLALAFIWPFGGGGRKVQMMAGTAAPAARATITINNGNNGNTRLDIKAQHLAAPNSLTPPENVYVLWIQPPGKDATNQGQLRVGQNLNAELNTETPYKRFKVFVTAEQNAQAQMPEGPQVLSADVAQG